MDDATTQNAVHPELLVARLRRVVGRGIDGERRDVIGRVQEGVEQIDLGRMSLVVQNRHGLADQRVPEAIRRRRELMRDPRIDSRIVAGKAVITDPLQAAQHLVGEFGEDDALILRLVDHLRGLEEVLRRSGESGGLEALDVEVVVPRPDRVDRGQADILVRPSVASHVMVELVDEGVRVEQKRMPAPHEVGREAIHLGLVDLAIGTHQSGKILPERGRATDERGIREYRIVGPVMLDQLAQVGQKFEVGIRGI